MVEKIIYKYRTQVSMQPIAVEMPQGAHILTAHTQGQQCQIWALVDPQAPKIVRRFRTVATGEAFDPTGLTYIGSFHDVEGWMVFHLFECGVAE